MSKISAIHWKLNHAPGLRCFATARAAIGAGEDRAALLAVGGVLIKWPAALGAPPDDATVAAWEAEYDAAADLEGKRAKALQALEDKREQDALAAALNDPNAPQAVKDYKAAKK